MNDEKGKQEHSDFGFVDESGRGRLRRYDWRTVDICSQ